MAINFVNNPILNDREWTTVVIDDETEAIIWTNFIGNVVPTASDDVIVDIADVTISNYVFDHHSPATGSVAVNTLQIAAGGSLTADYSLMRIHGSLENEGSFTIATDRVTVFGDIVNNYLVTINGESGASYLLMDAGTFNLSGTGNLRLTSNSDGTAYLSGRDGEITDLNNSSRISGTGFIGWSDQIYYPGGYVAINNSGIIDANVSNRDLIIAQGTTDANPLTNSGSLVANAGGRLIVDHAYIEQSGAGAIGAYGSGSRVVLNKVFLKGGFLDTSDGGIIYLESASGYGGRSGSYSLGTVIDGSTSFGAVTITAGSLVRIGSHVGDAATFKGSIVNHGDIGVLGYWSSFVASTAGTTLTGGGKIHLTYNVSDDEGRHGGAFIRGESDSVLSTFTNVDNTIHGSGYIGKYGYWGYDLKQLAVINRSGGVIEADDPLAPLVINQTVSFLNEGVLGASSGGRLILGTNTGTPSEITYIDGKGGKIIAGSGSEVVFRAATVKGGTFDTTGNGVIRFEGGDFSALDGSTDQGAVTNAGTMRVDAGLFRGAIINNGTICFHPTLDATLRIATAGVTLSGTGQLTLGDRSMIRGESSSVNAVLVTSGTIAGGGFIGTTPYGPDSSLLTLDVRAGGVVRATAGKTMAIDTSGTILNAGIMEANGGRLEIYDLVSGNGALRVSNGGILLIHGDTGGVVTFSGSTHETLGHSSGSSWGAGKTTAIKGFALGDRLDLSYESGYLLSAPDSFSWSQSGENGTFRFAVGGSTRNFVFEGLSQLHVTLVDNGSGGLFLKRVATIDGTSGSNTLAGTSGNDRMVGFAGNDTFRGSAGNDMMDGGTGIDTVDYGLATSAIRISLATTAFQSVGGGQGSDSLRFIENVTGSRFDDKITGNSLANLLKGGAGHDTLDGGAGIDRLEGGAGNDTYIVDNTKDVVVEKTNEGTDLVKASVSHTLAANVENLTLTGSGKISGTGNTFANVLTGNSANNTLDGKAGADTLNGGAGSDRLIGGSGGEKDKLYGGSGADTFVFTSAQGATAVKKGDLDTIYDFSRSQGDRIDLKAIDANTKTKADNAFSFIHTDKFHKKAGELRYEIKKGDTFIYGDTNGDGTADFAIRLDLGLAMKGGDFIL